MKTVLVTGGSGFIGRHLVELLIRENYNVVNADIAKPSLSIHCAYWRKISILNNKTLIGLFDEIRPNYVIHLAAYASMEGVSMDEFRTNTDGTACVLDAVKRCGTVEKLIITSTQHVRKPGSQLMFGDTDYAPYMLYGQSKVITEELTRGAGLDCVWTIIRPTAVWGPHHILLANGLWRQMHLGRYFHPTGDPVVRSYGYVKNVVWQIEKLLMAERSAVDRKVFYVADGNGRQLDWVNALSRELTGHEVRTVPLWVLRGLSKLGDGLRACGLRFPLYDSRLKNLITPNPVPVEPTLALLGNPPYSLEEGARETVEWLRSYYGQKIG